MTDYNDGKWHGWNGGERPVHPETAVEVAVADTKPYIQESLAGDWFWGDGHAPIIAFRVVKEYREPREFWIDADDIAHLTREMADHHGPNNPPIHVREVMDDG